MKKKQKHNYKSKDKFWSGSGKFLLSVVLIYLIILGINELIHHSENQCEFFYYSDIQIEGNKLIPNSKILNLCGFSKKSYSKKVKIDIHQLAKRIMNFKYVKGVSITKRPPRILNITIEERQPIAFIYGKGLNLIDDEGFIIPVPKYLKSWDLPIITGLKNIGKLGEKTISLDAYLALEIIIYLEQENPLLAGMVSEINMSPDNYIELYLIKGGVKVRINQISFYKEIYTLKTFLIRYLDFAKLNKIEYIDLRFEDQLVIKQKT